MKAVVHPLPDGAQLVSQGDWEISVMSDGAILLPRFIKPADVDDFCAALRVVKGVSKI